MNERPVNLVKLKRHDEQEWHFLYTEIADRLFLFGLYQLGHDRELAKEGLQETFLRATKGIGDFEGSSEKLPHWFCGIMTNVAREIRRKERRWRQIGAVDEALLPSDQVPDPGPQPDEILLIRERNDLLRTALASLPTRWEVVLRLRYLDELSIEEIAIRLGVSPKAAESLLARARKAFQDFYSDVNGSETPDARKESRA